MRFDELPGWGPHAGSHTPLVGTFQNPPSVSIRLLTCILYNKLVNVSINISLSSVRLFSKLIEPKREACGNLPSTVSSSEAQATTWPPDWLLKGAGVSGYSCGTEPLTSGIWCCLQVHSVRNELNCNSQLVCRKSQNCLTCGKPTHRVSKVKLYSGKAE